jgi:hypothetical protein
MHNKKNGFGKAKAKVIFPASWCLKTAFSKKINEKISSTVQFF